VRRWLSIGIVTVVGVAVDQVTKRMADERLPDAGIVVIIKDFFRLQYSTNSGAFFGLGSSMSPVAGRVFFIVATLLAMGLIVQLYRKARADQKVLRWALVLLLAGAIGNLIDRVAFGEVTDFLHLHYRDFDPWATFNVADVYITFGLVALLIDLIRSRKREAAVASHDTNPP